MAYQELFSVANAQTLIDNICDFADANGWTVERNNLAGSNRTATIRISGTTDYIHIFNTETDRIRHRISVDYNGALDPEDHTLVSPHDGQCDLLTGPSPQVWLFADGNYIHAVVHTSSPGVYRFL